MGLFLSVLLIAGGMLAAAGLIVSKNPKASELIAKIQPYQAIIGIILLVIGVLNTLSWLSSGWLFHPLAFGVMWGVTMWGCLGCSLLLGIMFGMPMVARFSAGGAAKGAELGKKIAPYQTLIGVIAIASGVLNLLFSLGILHISIAGL